MDLKTKIRLTIITKLVVAGTAVGILVYALVHRNELSKNAMIVQIAIGMCGLFLLSQRDFYLPFLGECAIPVPESHSTIDSSTMKRSKMISLTVDVPPKTKVVYWAANDSKLNAVGVLSPQQAYGDFQNSGMVVSDQNGTAVLKIASPASYSVGSIFGKREIPKHVHYRYELPEFRGMFSRVFTKYI